MTDYEIRANIKRFLSRDTPIEDWATLIEPMATDDTLRARVTQIAVAHHAAKMRLIGYLQKTGKPINF